ncbi:MAG: transporter substrate-binding domain-containing protein [Chloroflexi bacterium]|nr:transporter substrate-binding domain-containing protein [Chloroflexota bacterium]
MNKKWMILVFTVALALLLAACGGAAEPAAPDPATAVPGSPRPPPKQKRQKPAPVYPTCKGREITIAVENAYLPFNYIDPATGEPAGWDYTVWNEICRLLNCAPSYIEAGWEGMIQAVADGQFDAAADGITIYPRSRQNRGLFRWLHQHRPAFVGAHRRRSYQRHSRHRGQ